MYEMFFARFLKYFLWYVCFFVSLLRFCVCFFMHFFIFFVYLGTIYIINNNIGLQCNLRFASTTVLQGSAATRVNDGSIFNDFFIANLL